MFRTVVECKHKLARNSLTVCVFLRIAALHAAPPETKFNHRTNQMESGRLIKFSQAPYLNAVRQPNKFAPCARFPCCGAAEIATRGPKPGATRLLAAPADSMVKLIHCQVTSPASLLQTTRWCTHLSAKVNSPHAVDFRVKCGFNLVK